MKDGRRPARATGSGEAIALTAMLVATTLMFLAATTALPPSAALVPRVVGVPLVVLLVYVLIRELRERRRRGAAGSVDAATRTPGEVGAVLWILALPAISTLLGFVAGPALYVFGWVRIRAGERTAVALTAGVLTAAGILIVFSGLLHVSLPHGLLDAVL
jgi:hypothetical protein